MEDFSAFIEACSFHSLVKGQNIEKEIMFLLCGESLLDMVDVGQGQVPAVTCESPASSPVGG